MHIRSFFIKNFQQFVDTKIDFTDPVTSEPADQICLIGRNGTGKSTILSHIDIFLTALANQSEFGAWPAVRGSTWGFIDSVIGLQVKERRFYFFYARELSIVQGGNQGIFLNDRFAITSDFISGWTECQFSSSQFKTFLYDKVVPYIIAGVHLDALKKEIFGDDRASSLFVYSPAETRKNSYIQISDVPASNLNGALALFKDYPIHHVVSQENIEEFWKNLIFLIKRRENERELFETSEKNLEKTKKQLIEEFEKISPKILERLASLWSKILDKADLEFDFENARSPMQLNDNLLAYIKQKGKDQRISYNNLSTGIRNFIFRIGHIYALYFNKQIANGMLLIDEPENSLFPDFLFDLVKIFQEVVIDSREQRNTQLFISTHSPIVAAQFEPHERIILEWEDGVVRSYKGKAPIGDDPNDILIKDFKLKNLMGEKGREMWEQYLDLRRQLRSTGDQEDKRRLLEVINKIGNDYNFEE